MATTWVIRLPRDDSDQDPYIIKISREEDGQDLDLDLLATDGERAFTGKGDMNSSQRHSYFVGNH